MRPAMRWRASAQVLVWLTVAMPLFISSAGLAIDGGLLLASRRQMQSVADGAARAGATRLDVERLRASGGVDVQLGQARAVQAVETYLAERFASELLACSSPVGHVEVGPRRVHVLIEGSLPTAFLRIARIDSVPVEASAFADIQFGIHDGAGG
jgi:Putative Flp pilus-assembly TadE/G-like